MSDLEITGETLARDAIARLDAWIDGPTDPKTQAAARELVRDMLARPLAYDDITFDCAAEAANAVAGALNGAINGGGQELARRSALHKFRDAMKLDPYEVDEEGCKTIGSGTPSMDKAAEVADAARAVVRHALDEDQRSRLARLIKAANNCLYLAPETLELFNAAFGECSRGSRGSRGSEGFDWVDTSGLDLAAEIVDEIEAAQPDMRPRSRRRASAA